MKLPRFVALALLFSALATTSAFADQLTLSYAPNNPGNGGGAFTVSNVIGGQLAGTSFNTFCLETQEFFTPGGQYNYVISSKAQSGDVSPPGDPISVGTAYLYNKYLNDGASYTPDGQRLLQQAIWFLEQEPASGDEVCGPECHALLAATGVALGGLTESQMMADCSGGNCYGVVALNLTDSSGNPVQDQLARVPEAGATLLLSMSLVGLAWFARRKNLLPQSSAQVGSLA